MKLEMNLGNIPALKIGKLSPGIGSLFVFGDTEATNDGLFSALGGGGAEGRCFFVIADGEKKETEVSIVSLDGAQILRRSENRLVYTIINSGINEGGWKNRARLSNVEDGMGVVLPYGDHAVYMKVKGNPTPQGKVILVSLEDGKKLLVDDDIRAIFREISLKVPLSIS